MADIHCAEAEIRRGKRRKIDRYIDRRNHRMKI